MAKDIGKKVKFIENKKSYEGVLHNIICWQGGTEIIIVNVLGHKFEINCSQIFSIE